MANLLFGILVVCLFKSTLSFCATRCDPLTVALEQILSDVTLEIVPCPLYPAPPAPCPAFPPAPSMCLDSTCQCGIPTYPECLNSLNPFYDQCCQFGMPYCPNCYNCGSCGCGIDTCPPLGCYRDIRDPCSVCEDLYVCFDNCGCDCFLPPPACLYYPQVEYPMSGMDLRPYYYGNCWCS